jgi:hypothetical protein
LEQAPSESAKPALHRSQDHTPVEQTAQLSTEQGVQTPAFSIPEKHDKQTEVFVGRQVLQLEAQWMTEESLLTT